jgi:hypothetical protein
MKKTGLAPNGAWIAAGIALLTALSSCATMGATGGIGPAGDRFPSVLIHESNVGKVFYSPVDGAVVDDFSFGPDSIVIRCQVGYYWKGEPATQEFDLIAIGVRTSFKGDWVKAGDKLGTVLKGCRLTARADDLNPYMVTSSSSYPEYLDGAYYFSPDWLNPARVQLLTFRQVPSMRDSIDDFYRRWAAEVEAGEAGVDGATIHYFPDLDRVCAKINLEEFPSKARRTAGLSLVEYQLYGKPKAFAFESELYDASGYRAILYWTADMRGYLVDEYELGDDLYVYCNILALDHETKTIVVCASDFTLRSPEEEYESRMAELEAR